jgi:hypothetical protein
VLVGGGRGCHALSCFSHRLPAESVARLWLCQVQTGLQRTNRISQPEICLGFSEVGSIHLDAAYEETGKECCPGMVMTVLDV